MGRRPAKGQSSVYQELREGQDLGPVRALQCISLRRKEVVEGVEVVEMIEERPRRFPRSHLDDLDTLDYLALPRRQRRRPPRDRDTEPVVLAEQISTGEQRSEAQRELPRKLEVRAEVEVD